jgi:hypothetical protein
MLQRRRRVRVLLGLWLALLAPLVPLEQVRFGGVGLFIEEAATTEYAQLLPRTLQVLLAMDF